MEAKRKDAVTLLFLNETLMYHIKESTSNFNVKVNFAGRHTGVHMHIHTEQTQMPSTPLALCQQLYYLLGLGFSFFMPVISLSSILSLNSTLTHSDRSFSPLLPSTAVRLAHS